MKVYVLLAHPWPDEWDYDEDAEPMPEVAAFADPAWALFAFGLLADRRQRSSEFAGVTIAAVEVVGAPS